MFSPSILPTPPSLLVRRQTPLIHRDLSWLQFNERVLGEARQESNPLLERLKFLSISASNIDEFFMVRFSSIQNVMDHALRSRDHITARRQKRITQSILESVSKFSARQNEALDLLVNPLEQQGIHLVQKLKQGDHAYEIGKQLFTEKVIPALPLPEMMRPQTLRSLENQRLVCILGDGTFIQVPKSLPLVPAFSEMTSTNRVYAFFLDVLLANFLPGALGKAGKALILKVIRSRDYSLDLAEEDSESIPDVVRSNLKAQERGRALCALYSGRMPHTTLDLLSKSLRLEKQRFVLGPHSLCFQGLWQMIRQLPPEWSERKCLSEKPLVSHVPQVFETHEASLFEELGERDFFLHHPYDSFDAYVNWIQAACNDPQVTAIEQTIYRMDVLSPIVQAIKKAAKKKKIRVLIELRARFDELNNLALAEELRAAGVKVAFGFGNLKLHAKIALVTRQEKGHTRLYTHLSTGNYNATTARQYTDMAILTSNEAIGIDARHFFDSVAAGQIPKLFRVLVPAPARLQQRILRHVAQETEASRAGKKARIFAKVNALVDERVIASLYAASQAGVKIDLVVRGACSLIPGVPGLSENISVISIIDRFLEHSRIYYFESAKAMYLSSADWMQRNFFSRLELAFPVLDSRIYDFIEKTLIPAYLSDTEKARELTPQGVWKKRSAVQPFRSQAFFSQLSEKKYEGTALKSSAEPKLNA